MADPSSVAGGVVSILSLGLQVTGALIKYYAAYRERDSDVDRTAKKLEGLQSIFTSLNVALRDRRFHSEGRSIIEDIEKSISSSEELIEELKGELDKFNTQAAKGLVANAKLVGRRVAYPFRQSTLQKLDEDNSELRQNLSLALECLQLGDGNQVRNDVEDIKILLNQVRGTQVSQRIREWLFAPDATIDHNQACAKKQPSSGLWLVKGSQFTTWLETENPFLWINGFAGSGKSVLCSTAIQSIFHQTRSAPHVGIAFFYFSFTDIAKQTVSGMLRALILQLANQTQSGQDELDRLVEGYKGSTAPDIVLIETLRTLANKFDKVYFIIDALDESPQHTGRDQVLQTLGDFRSWNMSELHVLVTSRDLPDIRESIGGYGENISMRNEEVNEDISNFISVHMQTVPALTRWSPAQQERIKDALITGAKGVFRWVECQLKALAQCPRSDAELTKRLKSLPRSLDETYERMLLNIDQDSLEDAKRVFTLLCFAQRPMTVVEVIHAIAVGIGDEAGFDTERCLQDGTDIERLCPGFIEITSNKGPSGKDWINYGKIDENDDIVRIAHFSVQEYLESARLRNTKVASFGLDGTIAHDELAQICLVRMIHCYQLYSSIPRLYTFGGYPLVDYAARYWYYHLQATDSASRSTHDLAIEFLGIQDGRTLSLHNPEGIWSAHYLSDPPQADTSIYFASLLGLSSILSEILQRERRSQVANSSPESSLLNATAGVLGFSVHAAALHGHESCIKILFEYGADMNAYGGVLHTALQAASCNGHKSCIEMLLEYGADINAIGGHYGSALQAASSQSNLAVVKMLVDCGAELHPSGTEKEFAVAALNGHEDEDIIEFLLAQESTVDSGSGRLETLNQALLDACGRGNKSIAKILIDAGAPINGARYVWLGYPLTVAAERGDIELMNMLLKHGAHIDAMGGKFETALQAAAVFNGQREVVKTLIDRGADINRKGCKALRALYAGSDAYILRKERISRAKKSGRRFFGNALQVAAIQGHKETVELLLLEGAKVNSEHGDVGSALHAAALEGHAGTVEVLLHAGADTEAEDDLGRTPVQVACLRKDRRTMEAFLAAGVTDPQLDEALL